MFLPLALKCFLLLFVDFFLVLFGVQTLLSEAFPETAKPPRARTVAALEGLYAQCSGSVRERGRCVHECLVKRYIKEKKTLPFK